MIRISLASINCPHACGGRITRLGVSNPYCRGTYIISLTRSATGRCRHGCYRRRAAPGPGFPCDRQVLEIQTQVSLENLFLTIVVSHSFPQPLRPIAWVSLLLVIGSREMAQTCAVSVRFFLIKTSQLFGGSFHFPVAGSKH